MKNKIIGILGTLTMSLSIVGCATPYDDSALVSKISSLETKLTEAEQKITALEGKNTTNEGTIAALNTEIETLKAADTQSAEKIENLTNEINTLKATLDTLRSSLTQLTTKEGQLEAQVATLLTRIATLEEGLAAKVAELEQLKARIDAISAEFTYRVVVTDVDFEVLADVNIPAFSYENLLEGMLATEGLDVVYTTSQYGAYITSINNSVVDPNWSLMIYVNGQESWYGADQFLPKSNDLIEIKNECWAAVSYGPDYPASFDEVDVLLDRAIYHYAKKYLKESVEKITSYTGSTYWEMLFIDMYKRNGLDLNQVNYTFKDELKSQLQGQDLSALSGANIGKYYTHAKVLNVVPETFAAVYKEKVDALASNFNQYQTPFIILPAASLGTQSDKLIELASKPISGGLSWGPDGNLWQYTSSSLFVDKSSEIDFTTYVKDWNSNTSNAIVVQAAAATNINLRDTTTFGTFKVNEEGQELDYIAFMFAKYFDNENLLMKVYTTDKSTNASTNQIYCGLLALKIQRDTNAKANCFGPIVVK